MTKSKAITKAKKLHKQNDRDYAVVWDNTGYFGPDTITGGYGIMSYDDYVADPSIRETDCVFITPDEYFS